MINYETILSSYDDKLTLMQWLKKVEDALKNASLSSVTIAQPADNQAILTFVFADGSSIASPVLTLPRGEKGDKGDSPTIDTTLSYDSENPVANKTIAETFRDIRSDISDTNASVSDIESDINDIQSAISNLNGDVTNLHRADTNIRNEIAANKVYRHEVSLYFNSPSGHETTLIIQVIDTKATAYSSFAEFMQVYGNTQLPVMSAYDETSQLAIVNVYLNHWELTYFHIVNGALVYATQDYEPYGVDTFEDNVTAL